MSQDKTAPIKPITLEELHAEHVRSVTNIVELVQREAHATRVHARALHTDIMAQYANDQRAIARLRKTVQVRSWVAAVAIVIVAVIACAGG